MKLVRDKIAVRPLEDVLLTVAHPLATAALNVAREQDMQLETSRERAILADVEYAKVPLDNDVNHAVEVMAAVHVLRGLCERHKIVVVFCNHAVNRSPCVVALWIAQQFEMSWQQAAAEVAAARPEMEPHRGLLRTIREIMGRTGPTQEEINGARF
jgi:predicted protein tyrosine phosphatase